MFTTVPGASRFCEERFFSRFSDSVGAGRGGVDWQAGTNLLQLIINLFQNEPEIAVFWGLQTILMQSLYLATPDFE